MSQPPNYQGQAQPVMEKPGTQPKSDEKVIFDSSDRKGDKSASSDKKDQDELPSAYTQTSEGMLGEASQMDPQEMGEERERMRLAEKKLLRKIDFQLMPILILIYILNYLDRNNITTARNRGFVKDLGLTDTEYQTALSLLYVGYITLQIPSNLFMAKVGRPSLYLPCCVAAWGVVSGCTALCENFHQLIVVRIFLGMVEAAFFPGALFLLSKWYKKSEIATRTALLFSGSIISNAFSGLVSAGILGGMDGKAGHAGWKWLFIIEGSITVVVAVLAIFILPDFPHNSKFLTEEERQMAQRRLSLDAGESDNEGDSGGAWAGFLLAVRDVKVWILALMLTSCTVGLAFNQFMPTLTATLEYNKTVTLLLTAPIWFFAFIICLLNGLHSDKVGERTMHIIVPLSVGCAGFIISSATMNLGGRFFALFIEASSYAAYTCILGWIAPSIPRPVYKRATALALINAFSQLGNISGSYVWPQKWGPRYWQSNVISLSMFMTTIALVLVHRFMLQRENRELDRSRGPVGTPIGAKSTGEGARYPNALVLEEDIQGVSRSQNISIEKAMQARADFRYML